jgi:hypothetical protein
MTARIIGRLMNEKFICLMQSLFVKVPLPAPGRAGNALNVENEWKVFLEAWKQTRHSITANPFQGAGAGSQVLQCLAPDTFINYLYRVIVCVESVPLVLLPASAVFFSSPASRSSYAFRGRNAPGSKQLIESDQYRDSTSAFRERMRALRP